MTSNELRDVIVFWCERGVRIFRVDNFVSLDPHHRPAHIFRIRRLQGRENGRDIFA